jgi:retron-type reverse transcriptase
MRLILEAIYEPLFDQLNVSKEFRPNMGCHDAIITIRPQTQNMTTAIEGDIKGVFDNLNHEILIHIISRLFLGKYKALRKM